MSAPPPDSPADPGLELSSPETPMLACRAARAWGRAYTAGLPDATRDRRRAELESDLWEHVADSRSHGQRRSSVQLDVLARVLVGVPADVSWHTQARRNAKDGPAMQNLRSATERAVSPVAVTVTAAALAVIALMTLALIPLAVIPLAVLVFFGTRSVLARRPSVSSVPDVPLVVDAEAPYRATRRHLRIVLAISGGIFLAMVATWFVLISTMHSLGEAIPIVASLVGMLSFFAAIGTLLLLGANGLGLQRLRIDRAPTDNEHDRLRHRAVATLVTAVCSFGLMIVAWMAMVSAMENLHEGLAVLVNVVAIASLFFAGGMIWLLAVTRRRHDKTDLATT